MTLCELSKGYEESAALLQSRLKLLRQQLTVETDAGKIWHLQRRIAELAPMLTEMNELAELTAHYYDRGYYRSEKYTLQRISGPAVAKRSAAAARKECD